jgi:hypothetical protein
MAVLSCQHIFDIIASDKPEDISFNIVKEKFIDDDYSVYYYCDDCIKMYDLMTNASYEEIQDNARDAFKPVCVNCIKIKIRKCKSIV